MQKTTFFKNEKSRFFDSQLRREHQISGARVIRTNVKSRQNIDHMKSARDELLKRFRLNVMVEYVPQTRPSLLLLQGQE